MEREQALEIIKKPSYDESTIKEEFNYIATKLGISSIELKGYFDMPKKYYYNYHNINIIFKFGAKMVNLMGVENLKRRKK
jgi:hypothetical protein